MDQFEAEVEIDGIAIVGMIGRFPKAATLEAYWRNLCQGVEAISFLTDEELATLPAELTTNPHYVGAYADIADAALFDAAFFGMSHREATIMDPQQRLFLECAWEVLEQAGYNPETYAGAIGVFASISIDTYTLFNLYSNQAQLLQSVGIYQLRLANRLDHLATRVAYKLNLKGPCFTVQTSCSSSLVAVHLACQSLLTYQTDMVLAGGIAVDTQPQRGYVYQEGMIYSPDGHCRAFDAQAQGVVGGNGVGVVLLKRLEDAIADGDTIAAVIKGSAINNDGATKVGYTAPSVDGQAEVVAMAQAMSNVEPETVTYIEAHGTATPLGDPIEVAALTKAFRIGTEKKGFCAIGSVKTNIGHLDTAAGIAGLLKVTLALKHKMIPPSLHFERPNPHIDFENSPFYVNTKLTKWHHPEGPRRAGVSSFGIGGTNAHVVLEEAPPPTPSGPSRKWQLCLLSAKTETALDTMTQNLCDYLGQQTDVNLADVAYTLLVGRQAFAYRRMVVCQDREEVVEKLSRLPHPQVFTAVSPPTARSLVFMFPGQGTQYVQMSRDLYQNDAFFREQVDRCAHLLSPHLGLDIRPIIYPETNDDTAAAARLNQTALAQPTLFVVEYALARLWQSWGIRPQAMIGHSIGEYTAACLAGVLTLPDALKLIAIRGRLMQDLPAGQMLAVNLSEAELSQRLPETLSLAAVNRPSLCVVSGPAPAVTAFATQLTAQKVWCQRLPTSHAFHSHMMTPMLPAWLEAVQQISLQPPQIPYISNVTGTWITDEEATDPRYWRTHLQQTVRFQAGIDTLLQEPGRVLLEVGPGRSLSKAARAQISADGETAVLTSLARDTEQQAILETLGRLWLLGIPLDGTHLYTQESRRRIPLPTYPFERQRYWIEPNQNAFAEMAHAPVADPAEAAGPADSQPHFSLSQHQRPHLHTAYVPPASALERQVAATWQRLLGLDQVGRHDDFFQLGGDSVVAVQIIAKLQETLQVELPQNIFLEAPTIAAIATWIKEREAGLPPEAASQMPACLVEIQAGTSSFPLFCIHAVGGTVYSYSELARCLGPEQGVYGLRAYGLEEGEEQPLTQVEEIARSYVDIIRAVQPEGPYFLCGYSFGGTVAFAMAQQLHAIGQKTALLALMDTPGPGQMPSRRQDDADVLLYIYSTFTEDVDISADELRQLDSERQLAYMLEKAKSRGFLRPDFNYEQAGRYLAVWKANLRAMWDFVPDVYPGRILFFRAVDRRPHYDPLHPEYPWIDLAAGGIDIYKVPGNHITMAAPPQVQVLAARLKTYLAPLSP